MIDGTVQPHSDASRTAAQFSAAKFTGRKMVIGQTVLNTLRGQVEPSSVRQGLINGVLRPHSNAIHLAKRPEIIVLRNEISEQEVSTIPTATEKPAGY